jgi:predicted Fe-Mo cluster-binding NifX family protein
MKIAIPSQGSNLDAPVTLRFSRCPFFLFVETDSGHSEALPNPAMGLLENAGIQAARFVVEHGAQAVIAVMIGQYAQQILQEAGVTIYELELPSGQQAVDRLRLGKLQVQTGPMTPNQNCGPNVR